MVDYKQISFEMGKLMYDVSENFVSMTTAEAFKNLTHLLKDVIDRDELKKGFFKEASQRFKDENEITELFKECLESYLR
jgi:hypothetical protein